MPKINYIITTCLNRWKYDLVQQFSDFKLKKGPRGILDWATGATGRRWERDFGGEAGPSDTHYAVFLVILSILPAAMIGFISPDLPWKVLAKFFGTPLQAVISGFLTSSFLFLGAHVNKVPRSFSVAYKLMLRVMAIYPFLVFLSFNPWLMALSTLIYGIFVIRSAQKTYAMKIHNSFLFFGMIYIVFALLQIQSNFNPATPPDLRSRFEER